MNRKTGKTSLACSCTYCLFLFAGVIIFFAYSISSAAEVTLAWDANTEPDLLGYKIYYDTSPGDPYYGTDADQGISPITVLRKDLDDPSNPKFTLTGLSDSEYYYLLSLPLIMKIWKVAIPMKLRQPVEIAAVAAGAVAVAEAGVSLLPQPLVFQIFEMKQGVESFVQSSKVVLD